MGAPGCDDAPVVVIDRGTARLRMVTLVLPYYENPRFFARQIRHLSSIDWEYLSHLRLIVVDDGSPSNPAVEVARTFGAKKKFASFRIFRIEKDVRWNWLAARNIGAHHADTAWIMLTDMDHVLQEDVLQTLVCGKFDENKIYRFSRCESTEIKIHPHPNSWFMTRKMFWKVGGYDEALSGYYGTDGEYRRRCAATTKIEIMSDELVRHEYEVDSSTTRYKRKQPEDARVKQMIRARGRDWKPLTLSFPYHKVEV